MSYKCNFFLGAIAVFFLGFAGMAKAAYFWSDNFESYPYNQTINNKGTIWTANNPSHAYVRTQSNPVYEGIKSLQVQEGSAGSWTGATWTDSAPGTPHGNLVELSLMMYVDSVNSQPNFRWEIQVKGRNDPSDPPVQVLNIGNREATNGDGATVDYLAYNGSANVWNETLNQVVNTDGWHKVKMDINFNQSPNQYRFCTDNNGWTQWFTLNVTKKYLRQLDLVAYSGDGRTLIYYDNFTAARFIDWKGGDASDPTGWDTANNWFTPDATAPNSPGVMVSFGNQTTANNIVDIYGDMYVGGINFYPTTSTTIQSTEECSLILNNNGSVSVIDVSGSHTVSVPVVLENDVKITGGGTLNLSAGVSGPNSLSVNSGTLNTSKIRVGTLAVANAGNAACSAAVPEPSTLALFGMACVGLMSYIFQRRKVG